MYLKLLMLIGVGGYILIKKVIDEWNKVEEESQSGTSSDSFSPPPPPPSPSYSKPGWSSSSSPPRPPSLSYSKPGGSSSFSPPPPSPSYPKPAASSFSPPPPAPLQSSPKPTSSLSPSYSKPGGSSSFSPPPQSPSYPKPAASSFSPPPPAPLQSSPKPTSSLYPWLPPPSSSSPKSPSLSSRSYSSSSNSVSTSTDPVRDILEFIVSDKEEEEEEEEEEESQWGTSKPGSYPKPVASKPTLFPAPPSLISNNQQNKTNYIRVDKRSTTMPIYMIPEDIKSLLEKDIVPGILKKILSPSYAEDYYLEKWDGFEMKSVPLELHEASIYSRNVKRKGKFKNINVDSEKDDKIFVEFEIDKIPERRPFLLSRDFASAWPSDSEVEPFQGIIYRVLKSSLVLVEFGEDFHSHHYTGCKYDVKFSFNRVCLKRAHQAIAAASDPLLQNFIFPDCVPRNRSTASRPLSIDHKLDRKQVSALHQMLSFHGPPPYLVEGPISVTMSKQLSSTGMVVCEAVLQIYRTFPVCRILICAPINSTCDVLMRSLMNEIPESSMFRANAAFRELDEVPHDVLPSCLYKGECFSCPPLWELQEFNVISSTLMSSIQLRNEGIMAGHFSHIFLVDASSATEPETMVALANLANERTTVVVTGAPNNHSGWIRSSIAKQYGLRTSYFQRLRESNLYRSLDPTLVTQLAD